MVLKTISPGYGVQTSEAIFLTYCGISYLTTCLTTGTCISRHDLRRVHLFLQVKTLISVMKARLVSLGIFLVISVYKLYNFWAWEVRGDACDWKSGWEDFHMNLNMPLTFAAYSYIPLIILLVCNSLIVVQLWRQQRHREDMTTNSDSSDTRRLTITVLVISSAYLVLTVPLSAYYTIQYADQQFINMTPQMAMGEMIILLIGLSNHSINFFLYVISSRSFRKVFVSMCKAKKFCKRKKLKYRKSTRSSKSHLGTSDSASSDQTKGNSSSQETRQSSMSQSQTKEDSSSQVPQHDVEIVITPES